MFTLDDLYTVEVMPQWSDISLQLYKEFSIKCLFPKTFKYYLENEMVVEIQFREWAMKHLWSIHHIDGSIKKEELFNLIDNGLTIGDFQKTRAMKRRLMDNKDRIRMFACVYTILKTGNLFYIEGGKLEGSEIRIDYIKSKIIDTKGVNVGMRFEEGYYIPITMLIDRAIDSDKTVRNLESLKVLKLEIIESDVVVEKIEYEELI